MKKPYKIDVSLTRLLLKVEKIGLIGVVCWAVCPVALGAVEKSVREHAPPTPFSMTLMRDAQGFLREGKWPEALTAFRQLSKESPGSFSIGMGFSRALFESGKRQEAIEILRKLGGSDSREYRNRARKRLRVVSHAFLTKETFQIYQDGINYLLVDRIKEAKKSFERALESEPNNVEVLLRLVQCHVYDQEMDRAIERLETIEKLDPFETEMRLWKARIFHLQGKHKLAIDILLKIDDNMEDSEHYTLWLSHAYWGLGERKRATEILAKNVKKHAWNILALLELAKFRLTKGYLNDVRIFLESRKDLQIASSRLDSLGSSITYQKKNHLDRIFYQKANLKKEIQNYLAVIDERLTEITRVKFPKEEEK